MSKHQSLKHVYATARHAGATLWTRDRRAILVYETIGVTYELLD